MKVKGGGRETESKKRGGRKSRKKERRREGKRRPKVNWPFLLSVVEMPEKDESGACSWHSVTGETYRLACN